MRTHDDEKDREHGEAHQLDGLAAPLVDEEERRPVAGDEARNGQDHVADGDVPQVLVDLRAASELRVRRTETNGLEDDRRVETEAIEGDVQGKPRVGSSDEQLEVLPPREVREEVTAGRFGRLHALDDRVRVDVVAACGQEVLDILRSLLDVALDVHREAGRLGDGETEVECDGAGDTAKADEDTPHLVNLRVGDGALMEDRVLVRSNDNERDEGCGWMT